MPLFEYPCIQRMSRIKFISKFSLNDLKNYFLSKINSKVHNSITYQSFRKKFKSSTITDLRSHPIQGGGSGIVRRIAEHMGRAFLAGASPPRGCVASQRAAQFSRHLRAQRLLLLVRLLLLLLRLLLRLLLHGLRDSLQRIRTDWYRYWSSLRL